MIRIVVMCHDAHTSVTAEGVGGTSSVWKAACDLSCSELNGSEHDNNSRIQSCPVAEHSLWDRVAEISKKKKSYDGKLDDSALRKVMTSNHNY